MSRDSFPIDGVRNVDAVARPVVLPLATFRERCREAFDRLYGPAKQKLYRTAIVYLALGGLVVHAALVFLARSMSDPPHSSRRSVRTTSRRSTRPSASCCFTRSFC